jgi:hypothetical protein
MQDAGIDWIATRWISGGGYAAFAAVLLRGVVCRRRISGCLLQRHGCTMWLFLLEGEKAALSSKAMLLLCWDWIAALNRVFRGAAGQTRAVRWSYRAIVRLARGLVVSVGHARRVGGAACSDVCDGAMNGAPWPGACGAFAAAKRGPRPR